MNVKRFFASNSRDALAMVKKALGPDAVILSNKVVNGGNEILALDGEEMDNLVAQESLSFGNARQPVEKPATAPKPRRILIEDDPVLEDDILSPETFAAFANRKNRLHESEPIFAKPAVTKPEQSKPEMPKKEMAKAELPKTEMAKPISAPATPAPAPAPVIARQSVQTPQELDKLMSEMRTMRGVIESQLSELVWENVQRRDPTTSVLLRRLLSAGFGASLSRQITENLPHNQTQDSALNWAKSVLEKNLNTIDDESDLLDKGGVFALIGPTGVGKTTTTAKLAARFVMKHGASKLGLITTDAYRIGGHEQLRIYGKILGVMVHAVKDEADLKIALAELKGKHTILIDTVGVNQRDEMVTKQIAMLAGAGNHIKRLLCINATSTGETLMDVVNAYRGKGLTGCIMTKMDEAATIGSALDVIIREKLRLYYVANGQRVPEDLHVANKKLLVHHAFKLRKSPGGKHFQFRDEDLPLLMAHAAQMSPKELSLG
ncbi:MAG: flagellar biosynthesis protein FlhF [Nitrosomonadales bacterium]|nr:flagellar biosynthesis protein FlhF [Nitrosomonadales bacterium]